jgi:hypothetical protein
MGCSHQPQVLGFSPSLCRLRIAQNLPGHGHGHDHPALSRTWATIKEQQEQEQSVQVPVPVEEDQSTIMTKKRHFYRLPKAAYRIYTGYAKRLWKETDVSARHKIANDKVRGTIRAMQHVLQANEYAEFSGGCVEKKEKLLVACEELLSSLPQKEKTAENETTPVIMEVDAAAPKKKQRSILFGAVMGAAVACWVFSGNYIFTGLFCLMTILGQLEYYRMIMNTGVYPARRISVIGASSMFLTVRDVM